MFFLLLLSLIFNLNAKTPLKITIYTHFNGIGLETDARILSEAIGKLGHEATPHGWFDPERYPADINIFLERILPDKLDTATVNWFISNPEWYQQPNEVLETVDLILCRTAQSQYIFQNYPTFYLGFTSPDAYRSKIKKNYKKCVHLPGSSHIQKGTKELESLWQTYPSLPLLTIVDWHRLNLHNTRNIFYTTSRLPEKDFRYIQNHYGIHLCPSSSEGFGHYIMEAMSTGAVVLTTNGSPMNELIKDPRCLIRYTKAAPYRLGVEFTVDEAQIKKKLDYLLQLPESELVKIGQANRAEYLRRTQEFHERLEILLTEASKALYPETASL